MAVGALADQYNASNERAVFDYVISVAEEPSDLMMRHRGARPLIKLMERLGTAGATNPAVPDGALKPYDALVSLLGAVATVTTPKTPSSYPLILITAIERLAGRLNPTDATSVDEALARVLSSYPDPAPRAALARSAAAIVGALDGSKFTQSGPLLAEVVVGDGQADVPARQVVLSILGQGNKSKVDSAAFAAVLGFLMPASQGELGYRPAAVARVLEIAATRGELVPSEVAQMADATLKALAKETDASSREAFARLLKSLAPGLPPAERSRVFEVAKSGLAEAGADEEATAWAWLIAGTLPPGTSLGSAQQLVNIIKYPTAAGEPTRVLFRAFTERFPKEQMPVLSPDQPQMLRMIEWLRKLYGKDLDLGTPPTRPPPLVANPGPALQAAGQAMGG
jgi:hypothetical protein